MGREAGKKSVKRLKTVVFSLAAAVVLAGVSLAVIHVAGNRNAEASASGTGITSGEFAVNSSEQNSALLYENRVSDIDDTAGIVRLLDAMNFENAVGKYTVKIYERDGIDVMSFEMSDTVAEADEKTFERNMGLFAQQLMALIEGIEKVEWNYPVASTGSPEESATGSLTADEASDEVGEDINSFGTSASQLHRLLLIQAET
ncbi:MAG: DUF4825 domain-containing protein [Lentihominibacter sp.]